MRAEFRVGDATETLHFTRKQHSRTGGPFAREETPEQREGKVAGPRLGVRLRESRDAADGAELPPGQAEDVRRLPPELRRRLPTIAAEDAFGLVASGALILVAGIIGIVVGTQSGGDTPNPSAAQTAPPAEPTVTGITVDELVDKLNMGGSKVGDQFRMTAELVGSDFWGTGASGDFFVLLKTKEESDTSTSLSMSPMRMDGRTARRSRWS